MRAYFVREPGDPDEPHLFSDQTKIDLADLGAEKAQDGAVGCAVSAALIGTSEVFLSLSVADLAAAPAASEVGLLWKMLEENVTGCAEGIIFVPSTAVALLVDPPDRAYARAAYPRKAVARAPAGCGRFAWWRRCRAFLASAAPLRRAQAQQASAMEALAIAANRYANARRAQDARATALQRVLVHVDQARLAAATATVTAARRTVAAALRAGGVQRLGLSARGAATARRALGRGVGITPALTRRLVADNLVTGREQLRAHLGEAADPMRARPVDSLARLRQGTARPALRRPALPWTVGDVTVLLLDLVPGRVVDDGFLATYERAATCDTSRAGLAALRTTLAGERAIPAGGRAVLDDAIRALLRTPGAPAGCG